MFYQLKENTYSRFQNKSGFIENVDLKKKTEVDESGAIFLKALSRRPQSLEQLSDKLLETFTDTNRTEILSDAKEFYDKLAKDGFLITSKTEYKVQNESTANQKKINSFRVYVTENCNAHCPSCVNANSRNNAEMSVEMFEKLCAYLSKNGIIELKIMGGEPSIHPQFETLVSTAQNYFKYITIFSNGLNRRIKNIQLRQKDIVTYNFLFRDKISKESLFLENGGERGIQVQILKNCDEKTVVEKIIEIASIDKKRIGVSLSLNCTSNIFKDKNILLKKITYIQDRLLKSDIEFNYDHPIPNCFLKDTKIEYQGNGICAFETAGVIDASMTLRFCLNYSDKLIKIYNGKDFISWDLIMNQLYKNYYKLRLKSLEKICIGCKDFNKTCNGGCWIPKDYITKKDIIENSTMKFS